MKIRPYADYVLVTRNEAPTKTPGGIFVPPTAAERDKPTEGTVVAVGPGAFQADGSRRRPQIEVGNVVVFNKFTGHEIEIGGVKHLFMKEEDILAVVAPNA